MTEFEEKLLRDTLPLFEDVDRVLLAVSGGADSVAMVYALHRLGRHGQLTCDFVIGHINHGLRGDDSDADQAFVKMLADSLRIDFVSDNVNVNNYAKQHKLSIETAGRSVRLQSLTTLAKANDCGCIATAHHMDDLAETMIHRLMRGTGFRGLCGIWPVSELYGVEFVRPLLGLRRSEIVQYCKDSQLDWREDVSNAELRFTRNRIRHCLLPILENESETIVERLEALSLVSQKFLLRAEKCAQEITDKGNFDSLKVRFSIDLNDLKQTAEWVLYEVIRGVLVELGVGLRQYTKEHFENIRKLIERNGSRLILPGGVVTELSGNRLFIVKDKLGNDSQGREESVRLEIGQSVWFRNWKISCRLMDADDVDVQLFIKSKDGYVEWFDADRISGQIEVRSRRAGDRFRPIGSRSEKKVGRFLQDGQLDAEIKRTAFVIADSEKILWLTPIRMAETVKINANTRHILEISAVKEKDDCI